MSWDIWVEIDTGNGLVSITESENYTHNCNHMIREAGFKDWSMEAIQGMPVTIFCDKLRGVIDELKNNPAKYEIMNPSNGWGSYETLIPKLEKLLSVSEPHTKGFMGTSF